MRKHATSQVKQFPVSGNFNDYQPGDWVGVKRTGMKVTAAIEKIQYKTPGGKLQVGLRKFNHLGRCTSDSSFQLITVEYAKTLGAVVPEETEVETEKVE